MDSKKEKKMADTKFEMETMREIWTNGEVEHYEVGPDRDGLQLVEIRYREQGGKIGERMSFPPELARLISDAMAKCADELEKKRGTT